MKLYLVRHGEAVGEEIDQRRPLSPKGREDVSKIAQFLKRLGIKIDAIWHSGKLRAQETAEIIAQYLPPKEGILEREGLSPLDPVAEIKNLLRREEKDILIVGHLPFLNHLISSLLFGKENPEFFQFPSAGVVGLERRDETYSLVWAISPDLI